MCNFLSFTFYKIKTVFKSGRDLKQHGEIEQKFNLEPQKDVCLRLNGLAMDKKLLKFVS